MRLRVVGWYDNATVFAEPQTAKRNSTRGDWKYYFKTSAPNAHLILETERDLLVPTKTQVTDKGFIGQRCVYYPSQSNNYKRFLESMSLLSQERKLPASTDKTLEFQEGQRMAREILATARNAKLTKEAKAHHGTICQACGFNFRQVYGERGEGFIEVHHKIMLASRGERASTVRDVDVLCANCHRMVHRTADPLSLADLKELIASVRHKRPSARSKS